MNKAIITQLKGNKKPSQQQILLEQLMVGRHLTQDDFTKLTKNNFARIAARAYDLKQKGYPILSKDSPLKDGTHFTTYYMLPSFIELSKQIGIDKALIQNQKLNQINQAIGSVA